MAEIPDLRHPSEAQDSRENVKNGSNNETQIKSEDGLESPAKTPTRPIGIRSPAKRSTEDLDNSARKKAHTTYSRLMDEDHDEIDSVLREQELNLAQKIIEDSKESAPPTPPKRKRGRPRKGEEVKKPQPVELTPRRRERRAVVEKRALEKEEEKKRQAELREQRRRRPKKEASSDESEEEEEDEEDEEFSESEEEKPQKSPKKSPKKVTTPRKPKKTPPAESPTPVKVRKTPIERRTKKGRPSKQEKVTGKVHSIFHMDDMEFFQDKQETVSKESSPSKAESSIALNFDNTGDSTFSYIPSISGLDKPKKEQVEATPIQHFEPLPVPEVDSEGNIKDQEYVKKYFPDSHIQTNFSGRLTDERAYFLEGSEGYFEQHNLRFRPSSSALSSKAPELDYDEFLPMVRLGSLVHHNERNALNELHKKLYHQWCFELSQGYNLNFYGIGSKANLILDFVNDYLLDWYEQTLLEDDEYPVVMVVNGYNPATKLKSVIHDIASAIVTPEIRKEKNIKMPKHIGEAFPFLVSYMKKHVTHHAEFGLVKPKLILVVHNIDGEAFRDERSQNILSQLASLPDVWLLTSVDNVNASLLWDLYRFKNFNFLWHDATTYKPYGVELSFKDVLSMGRSKRFVGSKGAKYVLTSLSSNAQNLYRVLSQMQLKVLEESTASKSGRTGLRGSIKLGVEFKALYDQCLKEYVTSNEMNFRSILGEYVEHKMCSLTKNASGKEIVFIPYAYDEIALILKDHFKK
ncbi:uncharacterized protein CXQ87_003576 [Candidozyma duobushaemuli]|nr:uncharacterized protein CXQ87_003576 [[Candida] duobushaemulonis]PVH15729.1 hypothetical protein CXQ87_003576 [[Candida] duobushaemulonis]